MLEWIKVEDQKPPYGVKVLIWNDCKDCRKSIEHRHMCLATPKNMSLNSFIDGVYNKALDKNDLYYDRYPDYCKVDHWIPFKPSHWAYVNMPHFED